MLRLDDVHTYYGDSHILQGVTLEVPEGSVIALLGRNGMGKTTTIHSIIGFTPPVKGQIIFRGINIAGLQPYQIARLGIALVPQGRRIFPSLTVKENLAIGWQKKKGTQLINNLEHIYSLFPVLKEREKHLGEHLSGGEQQMLAIGRALMTHPKLILMDEPLEGLAPTIIQDIYKKIMELKTGGYSILLVEQNIHLALKIADYVYIMNKGKIIYAGNTKEIEIKEKIKKFLSI